MFIAYIWLHFHWHKYRYTQNCVYTCSALIECKLEVFRTCTSDLIKPALQLTSNTPSQPHVHFRNATHKTQINLSRHFTSCLRLIIEFVAENWKVFPGGGQNDAGRQVHRERGKHLQNHLWRYTQLLVKLFH